MTESDEGEHMYSGKKRTGHLVRNRYIGSKHGTFSDVDKGILAYQKVTRSRAGLSKGVTNLRKFA